MDFFDNSKVDRIFDIVIVFFLLVLCGFACFFTFFRREEKLNQVNSSVAILDSNDNEVDISNDDILDEETVIIESKDYILDIKGAVKNPGVYTVKEGMVVNDVINLAGGLKSNASTKYINLSKKVSDEMVITIYTTNQIKEMNDIVKEECVSEKIDVSDCKDASIITSNNVGDSSSSAIKDNISSDGKVSLNNATKEELMTLNGVGESKALAIIEYREKNNGFKTLEELMNVSGIGETAYQKIKDNIKL